MKKAVKKLSMLGVLTSVFALAFSGIASAHVVVTPAEVPTASWQTFTMGVPNERDVPTMKVKLLIPSGLQYVSPSVKPGWEIEIKKEGKGEDASVKAIVWKGGSIGVGLRDSFAFSAKVPDEPTELHWKAYQTYADGVVVAWDQAGEGGDHEDNQGPFSVTKVVAQSDQAAALQEAKKAAAAAQEAASTSLYVAIAGVIIGLIAIYFATRKKA